jgi:farnesyl-diphosphate farnesyltransferase
MGNRAGDFPVHEKPAHMAMQDLLTDVLRSVSRSFYLTLRVLPGVIRPQIGLAYLLARATDTIADTELVPVDARLETLAGLRDRILGVNADPLEISRFLGPAASTEPERVLLQRIEEVLSLLDDLGPGDRARVREALAVIVSGQELDLRRFEAGRAGDAGLAARPGSLPGEHTAGGNPPPRPIIALENEADLDDYTYRVAGCVGEFWTRMCRAHLFPQAAVDDGFLLSNGVRFGKGLQLVNILRDLPRDLRLGRCYLPAGQLAAAGVEPAELLNPAREPAVRPVYHEWCRVAEGHLAAGWAYTNALPRGCARVRLACAWPILIGMKTLSKLKTHNPLDPAQRIKISRAEVRCILVHSLIRYPFPVAWQKLFNPVASGRPLL